MDEVFVYWDNSNIFHEAQRLADEEVPDARYRVRIHFDNLLLHEGSAIGARRRAQLRTTQKNTDP